LMVRWKCLQ